MTWFKRRYGAGPLHLLSLLACVALAAYGATRIEASGPWIRIAIWFVGAAVVHELVLWPLYALADRAGVRAARRDPSQLPPVPWINHLRVPAVTAGVLIAVSFPIVLGLAPRTYRAATGLSVSPYLDRWLLITGALFAASAVIYAARVGRAVRTGYATTAGPGRTTTPNKHEKDDIMRSNTATEMPAAGEGRPLGGQLDDLDALFDFRPTFAQAVARVTSLESDTRVALHELVCIVSTRLHVERVVLLPLLAGQLGAADYRKRFRPGHHRIEVLIAKIDRRHASDPELPVLFADLQAAVESNLAEQQSTSADVQGQLSDEQEERLRADLHAAIDTAMTRPHPHLPHHGPLGRLASTVTARVDRLRNRTTVR